MPDKLLHGNGIPCPARALQQEELRGRMVEYVTKCQMCDGSGRIQRPLEDIVAEAVEEARRHHWNDAGPAEGGA